MFQLQKAETVFFFMLMLLSTLTLGGFSKYKPHHIVYKIVF